MRRYRRGAGRRAIVVADAVMGISVLAVVAVVLVTAVGRQRLACQRLTDARQAVRAAEAVLADLQAGLEMPGSDAQTTLVVRPCTGDAAPRQFHWIEVSATVGGQTRALVGLVPDRAGPATENSR